MALADQLVDIFGLVRGEFLQAEVIHDEEIGVQVAEKPVCPGAVGATAAEIGEQTIGADVLYAVAHATGTEPKGLEDMTFSSAYRAADDQRLTGLDEVAGGKIANLLGGNLRVEAEVELFERFGLLEVGSRDPIGQAALPTTGDLVFDHQLHELQVSELLALGLVKAWL